MHTHLSEHLTAERQAELADDELTTTEAAHVAACDECARGVEGYRMMRAMARAEADMVGLPLTRWDTLVPRLRAEGLMPPPRRSPWVWPARVAAALLFTVGGSAIGRLTARPAAVVPRADTNAVATTDVAGGAGAGAGGLGDLSEDSTPIFRSSAEALATLTRAEREYRHAAAYLVSADPASSPTDRREAYRTRLAALDEVAQTTRAALEEAPNDPVLNQYYLSTVGARRATLRELRGALPVGIRLERY